MPAPFFLPNQREAVVDTDGRANTAWYRWMRALQTWTGQGNTPTPPENTVIALGNISGASPGSINSVEKTAEAALLRASISDARGAQAVRAQNSADAAILLAFAARRGVPFIDGGQLPATANNNNAVNGSVGEYISSNIASGAAIGLTSNVVANITSISLSPGDWDVFTNAYFIGSGTTTISNESVIISSTSASATPIDAMGFSEEFDTTTNLSTNPITLVAGPSRVSIATTAAYYMNVSAGFSVSTLSAYGMIRARRVR